MEFSKIIPRLLLSMGLLAVLVYLAQPAELMEYLHVVSPWFFLVSVGGTFLLMLTNALILWNVLHIHVSIGLNDVLQQYFYGWITEFLLPGKIGSFSVAYFLRDKGLEFGRGIFSVFIIKFFLVIEQLLILGIGILFFFQVGGVAPILGMGVLLAGIGYALFLTPGGQRLIRKWIPQAITMRFAGFSRMQEQVFAKPLYLVSILGGVGILIFIQAGVTMQLFTLAGFPIPFSIALFVNSFVQLAGLIPFGINGLGLREGALAGGMALFGVPIGISLIVGALHAGLAYFLMIFLSALFVKKLPIHKIEQAVQTMFHTHLNGKKTNRTNE